MTKRVLFAIGEMSGGGSERQMLGLLKHLDRDQFAPELYVISNQGTLLSEVPDDVPLHIFQDRHPQRISRFPGAGFRARVRDLASLLDEREIDVIYDRTFHMTLITAQATKKRPTPRISVIVTPPRLAFEAGSENFCWVKRKLLRKAYRSADRVLTVSDGLRTEALEHYSLRAGQVQTVYNLFDAEGIVHRSHKPLPNAFRFGKERFHVVASGRLHVHKGFDTLIEAARIAIQERGFSQLMVWILGTGNLETDLNRQIREAGLKDHIRLPGFQLNPLPFYSSADLFCLSSRYEGMPNVLVEAILCETPVVSTNCPFGPAEILEEGKWGGLVPVDDPQALARAFADAMTHPSRWKERAGLARQHIEKKFSLDAGLQTIMSILNAVGTPHAAMGDVQPKNG